MTTTIGGSYPAVNSDSDATINGLTVGKGGGAVATSTAVGYSALANNTTGSNNTAVGYQAGYSNTTAANNTTIGFQSLFTNTTGAANNAYGVYALYSNTTGSNNTAIGSGQAGIATGALGSNTTGYNNTALGNYALTANISGYQNTAVGYQAGLATTTGNNNVSIGNVTGANITTGGGNCFIGGNNSASSASVNYETVIGFAGTGKGTTTFFVCTNGGGSYQSNNSAAWSITSDQRLKKNIVDNNTGLSAINAIQVRNFEYRTAEEVTELEAHSAIDIKGVQLGAIAQELQLILPECVKTESTGVMSVDATNLTWYLINAVKELSAKVTALESKLGAV